MAILRGSAHALLCLLLLTACTTGTPRATPTTASPTPAPNSVVIALARGPEGVSLYRIGEDRQAVLLRTIELPPRAERAFDVTLSGSSDPDVCILWTWTNAGAGDANEFSLRCYPAGDVIGQEVPGFAAASDARVALSADGTRLAWYVDGSQSGAGAIGQSLSIAAYTHGSATDITTKSLDSSTGAASVDSGCGVSVTALTWASDRLLLECSGANDYPGGFRLQGADLIGPTHKVVDDKVPPYNYYTQVGSADATSALGLQGEYCEIECPNNQPAADRRAVRFDLATGKVLEVIAIPASGRYMSSVSGGAHGILYVTNGQRADAVYVRFTGEKHGTRVSGLPPAEGDIVAQP